MFLFGIEKKTCKCTFCFSIYIEDVTYIAWNAKRKYIFDVVNQKKKSVFCVYICQHESTNVIIIFMWITNMRCLPFQLYVNSQCVMTVSFYSSQPVYFFDIPSVTRSYGFPSKLWLLFNHTKRKGSIFLTE